MAAGLASDDTLVIAVFLQLKFGAMGIDKTS